MDKQFEKWHTCVCAKLMFSVDMLGLCAKLVCQACQFDKKHQTEADFRLLKIGLSKENLRL